jgi:maleamate amidohydrolase
MSDHEVYQRQGFGATMAPKAPFGLLLIDFVNGFADPFQFGGGNIAPAIERTRALLGTARKRNWPVAHSRIVFQDDDADGNIFSLKVPFLLTLKEDHPSSQIVDALKPKPGEIVVKKNSAFGIFWDVSGSLANDACCTDFTGCRCSHQRQCACERR